MIDFGTCKNCKRPIFWDWKGTHHVAETHAESMSLYGTYDTRPDFSQPECDSPEEAAEEE